jgi:cell division inhibitor SepF
MNRLVSTEVGGVQRNARDWLGLVEHGNAPVDEDGYVYGDASEVRVDDETPSGQFATGSGIQIAIVRPRNFRDASTVGEYYRQEIPVIINLEDMDNADATRIIDFVSGLILGLGGDIERISRRSFLIVPADAAILTTHVGLTEKGFFNQALRPERHFAQVRARQAPYQPVTAVRREALRALPVPGSRLAGRGSRKSFGMNFF